MLFDGSNVNFFIAFLAGLVAFFSPCIVPILPAYVSYFAGAASQSGQTDPRATQRRTVVNSLFFVLGFLVIFIILGIGATGVGRTFIRNRTMYQQIGGGVLILLGFLLLEVYRLPLFYRQFKINLYGALTKSEKLNALLVGLTFGFAWTPCIGPVLAVILFWSSQVETVGMSVGLLIAFSLGLGLPFVVASAVLGRIVGLLRRSAKALRMVQVVSGAFVVFIGILFLTKQFDFVLRFFIRTLNVTLPI